MLGASSNPENPQLIQDRHIRVFVSSTFRDMQEDRDYLVKFVFPQLRLLCETRGVTWGEVDLRWGITEEEAAEGKVLPLCLEEIHRCRPYFIGLLGERYGWVPRPEEIPSNLLEREGWLKDHFQCSVTELEIIHSVLREEEMHGGAFFYFRDPSYLGRLPDGRHRADFERESPEAESKLECLKDRIRSARDEQVCRLREDYHDPEELGSWMLEDFRGLIEELYPDDEPPGRLDRDAASHKAFAASRAGVYIGRQEYFDRLDVHVAADGPPLVVLGESGSGKSALLANWFLDYTAKHPDDFALIHFIGSTSDSADAGHLMQRIMLELKRQFDLPDDVPAMPGEIHDQFPQWLNKVAGAGRVVLVIDALNQLADQDNAPDLTWLPTVLPPRCRVILSTLPGRSLEAVRRRGWPEMTVQPMTRPEREELIEKFLAQFSRRLSPQRVEQIAAAAQTANPLFLRAMLDELRLFGEYDRLGEMIEHYLAAADPKDLYGRILKRWEKDYGQELVQSSLCLLWASRSGLAESELLDLLGADDQPLPHKKWTPFYLATEAGLARRSGLLGFSHEYLRDAVEVRCLPTDEIRKGCHRTLADYFHKRSDVTDRALYELPWQWLQAEEWTALKDLLTQLQMFIWLWSEGRNKRDLQTYWLALKPHYDPCDAYGEALDRWESESDRPEIFAVCLNNLAQFHHERAEYTAAEPLMRRALAIDEQGYGTEHPKVAIRLNNLAGLLQATNHLAEAEPLMRRALAIDEQSYGAEHPDVAIKLATLAHLLQATNRLAEAEPLMRRALAIDEQSYGAEHPDVANRLNSLAGLLQATNRLTEAEPLFRRALAIDEQSYGAEHPNVAIDLNNLAALLQATNRPVEAEPLMLRALAIWEQSVGEDHPQVAMGLSTLATLYYTTNRLAEAEPLMRRALTIDEQSHGTEHPVVATRLNNLATLLQATNRLAEAEPLMRRALAIDERSYGAEHPKVGIRLNNLATLLQATNRLAEAEPLMRRQVENFLRSTVSTGHEHPHLQAAVANYAGLLDALGKRQTEIQQCISDLLARVGMNHGSHTVERSESPGFEASLVTSRRVDDTSKREAIATSNRSSQTQTAIRALAFSQDGGMLVSGSDDGQVTVWNMRTTDAEPARMWSAQAHNGGTTALQFSPDAKLLLSGGADEAVQLWNVELGEPIRTLKGSGSVGHIIVTDVAFNRNATVAASFAEFPGMTLWELPFGKQLGVVTPSQYAGGNVSGAIDHDLQVAVLCTDTIELRHLESNRTATLPLTNAQPLCVAISPDASLVAYAHHYLKTPNAGWIFVHQLSDLDLGWQIARIRRNNRLPVSMCLSADNRRLAILLSDQSAVVWSLTDDKLVADLTPATAIALSADGDTVATGTPDGMVVIYDTNTTTQKRVLS